MKRIKLGSWNGKSWVNICLVFGIMLVLGYFLISISHPYQLPEPPAKDTVGTGGEKPVHKKVPFDKYRELLSGRNLFQVPAGDVGGRKTAPTIGASEILKKLALVGIVSVDGKPQALIMDREKKKQYYCKGGETIGNFKVEKVLEDKVILKYGDEEFQLRL